MTTVSVSYDGAALVPAPMVSIGKEFVQSGNGDVIGSNFTITLSGVIVKPLGSGSDPVSSLAEILAAQQTVRDTFKVVPGAVPTTGAGGELSISHGGGTPTKFLCHVASLDFEGNSPTETSWNQLCFYSVTLTASPQAGDEDVFDYNISDASETWDIEEAEDFREVKISGTTVTINKAYRVSHNISATGKPKYLNSQTLTSADGDGNDGRAWHQARGYVLNKLKLEDVPIASLGLTDVVDAEDVLDTPVAYTSRNHIRTQSVDEKGGTFSVTETLLLVETTENTDVAEETDITVSTSSDSGLTRVTLNGTIRGLDTKGPLEPTIDAYDKASDFWDTIKTNAILKTRAQDLSGITGLVLVEEPLSRTVSRNHVAGTITYSLEFDNRPDLCITGALSESVIISDSHPGYNFGAIPAIGRGIKGPVLQWLGAGTESKRTLTLELVVPVPTGVTCDKAGMLDTKPSVDATYSAAITSIIAAADPTGETSVLANKVFYSSPRESWDFKTGRYTLEIEWTYEYSPLAIFSPQIS